MTLKKKISFLISIIFTLVYAIACTVIILLFANSRKDDFKQRLEEKAITTIRLISDVKQFNQDVLKILDSNSINKLYEEKTVIFDKSFKLIYTSINDARLNWSSNDLRQLAIRKEIFKEEGLNETFATSIEASGNKYYIVVSAHDNYGKRKLVDLSYILVFSYLFFTIITWVLCFYAVKKLFRPLDLFYDSLTKINANNLNTRLNYTNQNNNEISLIAKEFNLLLERIEFAYQKQKDFTAQASHELRTPLARISAQIENFIIQPEDISKLNIVLKNVNQLSELVNSLLILSRIDFIEQAHQELVRVDEILYKCMDKAHSEYQNIEINFEILESNISEKMMLVKCNPSLLEIVFSNLIKNAYTYSTDKKVKIEMFFEYELMKINFINNGPTLSEKEKIYLYEPFMRGQNSKNTNGIGLGLRMVYRILNFYGFSVVYDNQSGFNEFALTFKHQ